MSAESSVAFVVAEVRARSRMGEPYPETEELLDYEEEEEAAPDAVAAKTNGETVKKYVLSWGASRALVLLGFLC